MRSRGHDGDAKPKGHAGLRLRAMECGVEEFEFGKHGAFSLVVAGSVVSSLVHYD